MNAQSVSMNIDTGEKTWLTPKWIIDVLGALLEKAGGAE